ncbi:citrinin biosynthesis oxidoreductase CtnB [Zopfia rhizophila CBS 207.26]|uniref:Citrinin biosynthesis oxidoreductase CtnB n=1 Tax=Zopfia rhizophila CBS 207.26 TaxID=1314779 RepID=A0A6A6ESS9_9PEZI|nr:citrinin biosynthesis oxidoreductase CtnB [Zopfia rhizophila CBS 207.26]
MTRSTIPADGVSATDSTSHLPRILCLHGGGTNSRIFHAQCRIIRRHLENSFRLVFSDAPYLSKPGPDVTSVYADWGPFRSWMKPQPGAANYPFSTPPHRADDSLATAMKADDEAGATGEWVGLLGFSQGAKLAASLLLREQYQMELAGLSYQSTFRPSQGPKFRFAILLAGRGPLVTLNPDFQAFFGREEDIQEAILRLPTVHVHGLQDEGLAFHRDLRDRCCVRESTTTVEWDGNHRVPIKAPDVVAVVKALMTAYQHSRAL